MFNNIDEKVVEDFGKEWKTFNYQEIDDKGLEQAFNQYFYIFPFDKLSVDASGFDMGCGSGRWARLVAVKVGTLHCIDASIDALNQAKKNLKDFANCGFECASVSSSSLPENSQDFGYCLGVLHHVPDTRQGLFDCVKKLKKGAPFLLYLYYRFDNKPLWFKAIWKASDYLRQLISNLSHRQKLFFSNLIALFIYWPLSSLAYLLDKCGINTNNLPLSDYKNKSLYFLKTDALDNRFNRGLGRKRSEVDHKRCVRRAGDRTYLISLVTQNGT
jgi:2-polyprenyl-3-methyl-5-hydroxy-6-metoxy-1,4-benzoquinol methylase